ncbi:MAG: PaaI family thioesterase, partial [Pseudomonadota bacterium]
IEAAAGAKAALDPEGREPALAAMAWRPVRAAGFNAHVGPVDFAPTPTASYGLLALDDRHINAGGVCHGGVLLTMADITMGKTTFDLGDQHPCSTIQMDCHFVAAAKIGQVLLCRAHQVRKAGGLSFMACEMAAGARIVARASGVWKYLASRAPGQARPGEGLL